MAVNRASSLYFLDTVKAGKDPCKKYPSLFRGGDKQDRLLNPLMFPVQVPSPHEVYVQVRH
jgi:hypothetical protein